MAESKDTKFKPSFVEKIFFVVFHTVNPLYWLLGLLYFITETKRYEPIRPGDAFAMMLAMRICLVYCVPTLNVVWLAAWYLGILNISMWWLVAGNVALFLLPPVYATLEAERLLRMYKKDPAKFWS